MTTILDKAVNNEIIKDFLKRLEKFDDPDYRFHAGETKIKYLCLDMAYVVKILLEEMKQ